MEGSGHETLRLVRTVAWRCGVAFKAGASKEKMKVSAELQKACTDGAKRDANDIHSLAPGRHDPPGLPRSADRASTFDKHS